MGLVEEVTGRERLLEVRGRRAQLFEGGEGPPLLYLHGAETSAWMPVHDRLAARRRVYCPAHPGFGATEGADEIESMEDLVFHTVDVLDALGLDRVDVVGVSLGGWLAAELALRHPGRVQRLVLVDAAGVRVPGAPVGEVFLAAPPRARALLFHDPSSDVARTLVPDTPPPERLPLVLHAREAAARLLWNPHREWRKLTSRLGRIGAPTLIVWGENDRLLPLAYGEAYARGIPGATLVTIERCGHLPPVERPDAFLDAVRAFLG